MTGWQSGGVKRRGGEDVAGEDEAKPVKGILKVKGVTDDDMTWHMMPVHFLRRR